MAISFTCSECGKELTAPDDVAGRRCRCRSCGASLDIPSSPGGGFDLIETGDEGGESAVGADTGQGGTVRPEPAAVPPTEESVLPSDVVADLRLYARGFKSLGFELRLKILFILSSGPRNVSALVDLLGSSQPTISHHLGKMRAEGMVHDQRRGKSVDYEMNREHLAKLARLLNRMV